MENELNKKIEIKIKRLVSGNKMAAGSINSYIKTGRITLKEVINIYYNKCYKEYIRDWAHHYTAISNFFDNLVADINEIADIILDINDYMLIKEFLWAIGNDSSRVKSHIKFDKIMSLLKSWVNMCPLSNDIKASDVRYVLAKHVNKENFNDAFKEIISTENGVLISGFMQAFKFDLKLELGNNPFTTNDEILNKIVKTKNAELIYEYVLALKITRSLNDSLVSKFAKAIIETKNDYYIYRFAMDIPGAPMNDLVNAIIELKSFKYMCLLVKNRICENQLFLEIIKLLGIQNNSIKEIETALKYLAQAGNFSELSVDIFIIYYKKLLENKNPQNEITTPQELFNSTKRKLMARNNVKANNPNSSK